MEILALWRMVRRRWWLILLPVVASFLLMLPSLPGILNPPSRYTVAVRFTAASPADSTPASSYEDNSYVPWLASEYVVVNLPQWITSDSFAREVSAELEKSGLTIAYEDVRAAFVADAARSILVVYLNWDNADEIERMAEAAITVLQTRNQQYFPQFAAFPAQVVALDEVRVNEVPPALTSRLDPLIRLIFALAAGIGLAVAAEFLDDTIHTKDDLLGLEVIGLIPGD